jgi:hypothetical protein
VQLASKTHRLAIDLQLRASAGMPRWLRDGAHGKLNTGDVPDQERGLHRVGPGDRAARSPPAGALPLPGEHGTDMQRLRG